MEELELLSTMDLPQRLQELRLQYSIPTSFMASFLGVSLRAYQYYENGKRTPSLRDLVALADFYCVSMDSLIGRKWPNDKITLTPDLWVYKAMASH